MIHRYCLKCTSPAFKSWTADYNNKNHVLPTQLEGKSIRENRAINTSMIHNQNIHRLQSYGLVCFERWPITRTRAALSSLSLWLFDFNSSTSWKIQIYSPITNILPSADQSKKQAKALSLHLSKSSGLIRYEPNTVQAHNKWQTTDWNQNLWIHMANALVLQLVQNINKRVVLRTVSALNNAQNDIRGTQFKTE